MYNEPAELLDVYRSTPRTLHVLLKNVNEELAHWRPAEGEWSIVEVVAHIGDTEERNLERVRLVLAEDEPMIEAYDQDELARERDYYSMDLASVHQRFNDLRSEQLELLEGLDEASWQRAGLHTEGGRVTIQQLTLHMAAHDTIHLAQISDILAVKL